MYAIVEIQGQQFKVEEGRKLFVHHIREVEQGAEVTFDRVMLLDKDGAVAVGAPTIEGAQVAYLCGGDCTRQFAESCGTRYGASMQKPL